MKKELDIYWENCIISETEKESLLKKYSEMLEETKRTNECLENNNFYSWSIITGYYIMFYKTLILLAKNHNLKPKNFEAHSQIIKALHVLYNKRRIGKLLDVAYHRVKQEQLPGNLLYRGKDLRNKVNYITSSNANLPEQKELNDFTKNVKNEFIKLVDKLIINNNI